MQEACNGKLPEDSLDELLRHDIMWSAKKSLKYGLVIEIYLNKFKIYLYIYKNNI